MKPSPAVEGKALVYCQGAFGTTNGKTAHGLVRRSRRYSVAGVIDRRHAGQDAGKVLDGRPCGIPIFADLDRALAQAGSNGSPITHLVVGLAPDGGRLSGEARRDVLAAVRNDLSVVCGLHDYLAEDPEIARAAAEHNVELIDVRRPPPREKLHFFSGKIEEVDCLKVAILGTDSAIGKRTTAWLLVDALIAGGLKAELIGTGQTAWMQGARYGIILDSLVNDFVSGEIEHAVWRAWSELSPDVLVLEGQGSLMNPAYPGGFELMAAGRPDLIVVQHAPARKEYDGFPGYPMHPIEVQIQAIELISGRPVVAVTLNHENLSVRAANLAKREIRESTGLPVCDPLRDGLQPVVDLLFGRLVGPYESESEDDLPVS